MDGALTGPGVIVGLKGRNVYMVRKVVYGNGYAMGSTSCGGVYRVGKVL